MTSSTLKEFEAFKLIDAQDYIPATIEDALYSSKTDITIALAPLKTEYMFVVGVFAQASNEPSLTEMIYVFRGE
jgi:hypothetical protein